MHDDQTQQYFWQKVTKLSADQCWPWTGAQASSGYGRFHVKRRPRPAHQVSWEIKNQLPFPAGSVAMHSCDNPLCVNPNHIVPGTQRDNILDCIAKGRSNHVVKEYCSKGHKLTLDNRIGGKPNGRCHECMKAHGRKYMAAKRKARKGL